MSPSKEQAAQTVQQGYNALCIINIFVLTISTTVVFVNIFIFIIIVSIPIILFFITICIIIVAFPIITAIIFVLITTCTLSPSKGQEVQYCPASLSVDHYMGFERLPLATQAARIIVVFLIVLFIIFVIIFTITSVSLVVIHVIVLILTVAIVIITAVINVLSIIFTLRSFPREPATQQGPTTLNVYNYLGSGRLPLAPQAARGRPTHILTRSPPHRMSCGGGLRRTTSSLISPFSSILHPHVAV